MDTPQLESVDADRAAAISKAFHELSRECRHRGIRAAIMCGTYDEAGKLDVSADRLINIEFANVGAVEPWPMSGADDAWGDPFGQK